MNKQETKEIEFPVLMKLQFSFVRNEDKVLLNYLGSGDTYADLFIVFEGTGAMLNDLVCSGYYDESNLLEYVNKSILEAYQRFKLKSEAKK